MMSVWYHLLSVLSTLATGPVCGHAPPLTRRWDETMVKHSWNAVPDFWESLGHPPADTTIDLYLALRPQHENAVVDALHEVSNPRHAKYGAHLSKEQVADLVAPHPDTLNLVNSWLDDYGIPPSSVSLTLGGNWLMVIDVPVHKANEILGASYRLYQHVETNDTVLRTVSYSLPKALHGHVQTAAPTTYFGSPRTQWREPRIRPGGEAVVREEAGSGELVTVLPSRQVAVTPAYLRWLYKTTGYVPAAVDQNSIGTGGYLKQYPSPQDLRTFMEVFRTEGADATFTVVQIKGGGYDESNPSLDANLNLQLAEAMTYPTPNIYYSTGGGRMSSRRDPFLNWLRYVLGQNDIPQTISTTYSANEVDVPQDYAERVCELFAQFGLRGVSILFSTGDWGVGGAECSAQGSSGEVGRFLPQFPASCPWITTVGGTTSDHPEVAASLSGGGFSDYFPRPPYQANAVPAFLHSIGDMHKGLFNPDGRGLPDIAAQALNLRVVLNGQHGSTEGTSGSAPIVAGIISLLNDYLISQGKPSLGFLNLWLYGGGLEGFNDITYGWNPGCGTYGFPAIIGWDPVTGLGTPDFTKLEEIIRRRNLHGSSTISIIETSPPISISHSMY